MEVRKGEGELTEASEIRPRTVTDPPCPLARTSNAVRSAFASRKTLLLSAYHQGNVDCGNFHYPSVTALPMVGSN